MSSPASFTRIRRATLALAVACAFAAIPAGAQASAINLGTVSSFVVLGGASVTNIGPSVLDGDLGVSPGTSLTGFNSATVNGDIHNNDGVASGAQADLAVAYDAAAGQPVTADLTGQDLGGLVLTKGAYNYASSAQLTGTVTLDAEGDPNAQFVFMIGSTLTTASASRVELVNGASPCNVFWQIGSSATLGTTTAFQGNVMTLADITANNGASVIGRLLARTAGAVSLENNVLNNVGCGTGPTTPPESEPTPSGGVPATTSQAVPVSNTSARVTRLGTAVLRRAPHAACTTGFRATVSGRMIRRVDFSLDNRRVGSRIRAPFAVSVQAAPGVHWVRARVTFSDATRARTLTYRYRACAAAVLRPRNGPSRFTG